MKQILQNAKTGAVAVTNVPAPVAQPGFVVVRTAASLISAGTERLTVEAGQKNLVSRALEQPALVRKVLDKAKSEGVVATFDAVRSKLGSLTALGYSAAGTIAAVGEGVTELRVGDRVACAGVGYASHAEVLSVPKNLCVRIPDDVSFEHAAFGTVGAIALQGVRLAEPTLGESVAVIGLGLIGQLAVQLLTANGCRVFGIDLDQQKIELAKQLGADDGCNSDEGAKARVLAWSRGRGADAVLITAATSSNEPVELAGEISRAKGRVIVVGAVGLNLPRKPYYDRELTFRISMSYGPGRYDRNYEERGHDYPFSYVRWTEGRNIEAFLDLVSSGRIKIDPLITHRFKIEDGEDAYELITGDQPYLGVLLQYDTTRQLEPRIELPQKTRTAAAAKTVRLGVIGAGDYAKSMLLPNFKAAGAEFQSIATASGVTARAVAEQHGFRFCASGGAEVINDAEVNLVMIATRPATHGELATAALLAGKNVFVEKPLALNDDELERVMQAAAASGKPLMVGFNRRFAPLAGAARDFFTDRQLPLSINYRVNAGRISPNHWVQDPSEGGRIIGEVCHFIDLIHFLTGSLTTRVFAEAVANRNSETTNEDSVFVTLRLADGSNASIAYLAEGDKALPKERIEIFGGGKSFVLDDFRSGTAYENGREKTTKLREQDKGQRDEVRTVMSVVLDGKPAAISLADLKTTTRATFRIRESLQTGLPVEV
ncbi:MAG TPA: bi-domain-containing oxidoreductase [Pyrinomonadaceae bacterium]|nr:bi-domain-containing oxidoreductase [Pyrinomonadaceae bacterium]